MTLANERSYNCSIGVSILAGLLATIFSTILFKNTLGLYFVMHPFIFSILYLVVGMVVGNAAIKSNSTGVSFGLYMVLSVATGALLSSYIPYVNPTILTHAAIATVMVVTTMIIVAALYPSMFERLGRVLCCSLLVTIVVELVLTFVFRMDLAVLDWIVLGIFALYVGYDWQSGMKYPASTKYAIVTSICLYMDIINIFVRLVSIFSRSSKN